MWDSFAKKKHEHSVSFIKNYSAFYIMYYIVVMQGIYFWYIVYFVKVHITILNNILQIEIKEKEDYEKNINSVNILSSNNPLVFLSGDNKIGNVKRFTKKTSHLRFDTGRNVGETLIKS